MRKEVKEFAVLLRDVNQQVQDAQIEPLDYGGESILPSSILRNTRSYLEKISAQINKTYDELCFDACAILIRRLVEMLLIEMFENKHTEVDIYSSDGSLIKFSELLKLLYKCRPDLRNKLGEECEKIRSLGNLSAHKHRYNVKRQYINELKDALRILIEDLAYYSGIKK